MKNFKLYATLFLIIGVTLTNCEKDDGPLRPDCGCPQFKGDFFDITGIDRTIHYAEINAGKIEEIEDYSPIPFKSYLGFSLQYKIEYVSYTQPKINSFNTGKLYVCTCSWSGTKGSKEEMLKNLTIVTLHDYNDEYLKNDTINDIMVIGKTPISDYLNHYQNDTILYRYLGGRLRPTIKPSRNPNFKVKIILELSTGELYETTPPMIVFE